jgi:uncharacterized protein (DUF1697 family)
MQMGKWVALLRGVNVGGGNKVPMAALRAACSDAGLADVQSYIASGNLVFSGQGDAAGIAGRIAGVLDHVCDVQVPVLVLEGVDMQDVLAGCPWPDQIGNLVHAVFCFTSPQLDRDVYETLKIPSEEIVVKGKTVWLHAPEGVGRSKLFAKIDKVLPNTQITARNLNTVRKLSEMLDA